MERKMASFKQRRMAWFYQECQQRGCTDMHDKAQRLEAEEIAYSLVLIFDDIASFFEEARICDELIHKEEAEARQRMHENELKAREEELRRAVPGELLLSLFGKADEKSNKKVISVFIRPDNSIYSTFDNKTDKIETVPIVKAQKVYLSLASFKPSEAVFTGATVGGITTGGIHHTKAGYEMNQTNTGKGEIKISMHGREFVLESIAMSDFTKDKFKRDKEFKSLVKDNKILCYNDTSKSNSYTQAFIQASLSRDQEKMMNFASMAADERRLEYKKCVSIQKLVDQIIKGNFPPSDEEIYSTAEVYAYSADLPGLKRAIETYTSIIDYKDSKQRINELQEKYDELKAKEDAEAAAATQKKLEKISKVVAKTVKTTRTSINIVAFIVNLFFTVVLALFSFLMWTDPEYSIISAILITISTLVSLPGIGKLVFNKNYKLSQKIIRWAIVILLFIIGFAFSV